MSTTAPQAASNPSRPLLRVRDLSVCFDVDGRRSTVVENSNFEVHQGEILAIVGESGSGKSITAMSILGLLPGNATVTGDIEFDGTTLATLGRKALRKLRGGRIAMIFQDPAAALNPVFTLGFQLAEAVRQHHPKLNRAAVKSKVIELLTSVEIPEPERRLSQYPHQISGGQCQRVMIAMALAGNPALLIADEPTTALDVTVQAEVLEVLRRLRGDFGSSVLIITHDMGVVADLADRVVVMRAGRIVETNEVTTLFKHPAAAYTRDLLAAVPRIGTRDADPHQVEPAPATTDTVLDINNLTVEYRTRRRAPFRAVNEVGLTVDKGEIVALVGESGSGKTTIAMAAIGLAPVSGGTISIAGISMASATREQISAMRQRVGVVFQNPATSLNPRYTVGDSVGELLRVHRGIRGPQLRQRVDAMLDGVGLTKVWRERYPHELSGGQRQRVAIARAVSLEPDLLIADEPTSALDVSVQARVLDVFRELQARLGFACLFVTHDLAVVDTLCDRVAVMNHGELVELGNRTQVLGNPQNAYTRRLIGSAPIPDPGLQRRRRLERLAS